MNRYKEVLRDAVTHRAPKDILADLAAMEDEIREGMKTLEEMLG